ncbi:HAD family phosphatase [bacterium]|nr:HAD family phosphatase [bacterium]
MRIADEFVAVIFDVDGVLVDTMGFHVEAWVRAGEELGIEIDEHEIYEREGEPGLKTAKDIIKRAGLMSTRARAETLIAKKEENYKRLAAKPRLFPGAEPVVRALFDQGLLTAFVTGTSRHETESVLPTSLMSMFRASVCGDEVTHGKPNPEPYMKGMRILGVAPRETLVIENAPFGIRSAKTAGATVWALRSYLGDESLSEADRLFDALTDILPLAKAAE